MARIKNFLISVVLLSITSLACYATSSYSMESLDLQYGYVDPQADIPIQRMPRKMPSAYIDDYTIYIGNSVLSNCTLQILNVQDEKETVIFSDILCGCSQYSLPRYIQGEYIIKFIVGNEYYWANISL